MRGFSFRTATDGDLDRLLEVHVGAFPDGRGMPARRRNFADNPLGTLDDLHIVTEGDRIVGHAFLFRLGGYFGGKRVPIGAIASVGVAPEARGRGAASFLMDQLHHLSDTRRDALTMLYAFRYDFYGRHGYARASTHQRIILAPRSVPRAWVEAARACHMRSATGADRPRIKAIYDQCARSGTGHIDRPETLWDHLLLDERIHISLVLRNDQVDGYVLFEHLQAEPHAATRIRVRDLAAVDDATRRLIFGLLGAQADQAVSIDIDLPMGDPMVLALGDIDAHTHGTMDLEHPFGVIAGGPMVRMHEVTRALQARGYARDSQADLVIDGAAWTITTREGDAHFVRSKSDGLTLSAPTLGAIAFGSLTARGAVSMGLAQGSEAQIASVDQIFGGPPFFSQDHF